MQLLSLLPTRNVNVIDVVESAGISVESWGYKKNGILIDNPVANQSKIYKWSFGGGDQPTLLFLWHDLLELDSSLNVTYKSSLSPYINHLGGILSGENKGNKNTARLRLNRAHDFQEAVRKSYLSKTPCRVAILTAKNKELRDLDDKTSVEFRELDLKNWYVHDYDGITGDFKIVREVPPISTLEAISFEDIYDPPFKKKVIGDTYIRSLQVKNEVFNRSEGRCEYCNDPGFITYSGYRYLEIHHVIPLAFNGSDHVWNTVALCPNDHKKAHFSHNRYEILMFLHKYLLDIYSNNADEIINLLRNSTWDVLQKSSSDT